MKIYFMNSLFKYHNEDYIKMGKAILNGHDYISNRMKFNLDSDYFYIEDDTLVSISSDDIAELTETTYCTFINL